MSGRLATTVHVIDDKGGRHVFGPADEKLPDWALAKIGAHCFEDGEHPKPSLLKKAKAASSGSVSADVADLQKRIQELESENETLRRDLADAKSDQGGENEFDPSEHNVDDVNAYLEKSDADERARVLEAEADGKARAGIVNGPHAATE